MLSIKPRHADGFTLIEVLIALAIMSIALTAILLTLYTSLKHTRQIQETNIAYFVSQEGLHIVQMKQISVSLNQTTTPQQMPFFGKTWYWQATAYPTDIPKLYRIEASASLSAKGPYSKPSIGFVRIEENEYE